MEHEKPQRLRLWGFSIPNFQWEGLSPQAGYQLLVAVQPFDDVVAGYTSRNGNNKRNKSFHPKRLLSVPSIGGGNICIIAWLQLSRN